MQDITDAIYTEIDSLFKVAESIRNVWMRAVAQRELNRNYSDWKNVENTNYELRIEQYGYTFRVRWHEIRFVRNGSKTIRLVKSLPIPVCGKYSASQFKKADEWEATLIRRMEDNYADIRYQLKHLSKAHCAIVWAAKKSQSELVVSDIASRVTRTTKTIQSIKESMKS